jgi:quercetin 2,3-dioxygenase
VISIHRGADRFRTDAAGVTSWHSFSFGSFHDPANTHHGLLIAHNEDTVAPGAGFDPHPHRATEIVTWVLSGELLHSDSAGHTHVLGPGMVQRVSAGTGMIHSERNASGDPGAAPVHYLQMWVVPDERATEPDYVQAEVTLPTGELVPIVSGLPHQAAVLPLGNRSAGLSVAELAPGDSLLLPDAPYLHLQVTRGQVDVEESSGLVAGDAVRLTEAGARRVQALEPAQLLVWEMLTDAFD